MGPLATSLIEHLRASGTGQSKLDRLAALVTASTSPEDFVTKAATVVGEVTLKKIGQFLKQHSHNSPEPPQAVVVIKRTDLALPEPPKKPDPKPHHGHKR